MTHPVRALSLDVGTKRIGVAVSDELGMAAHAVETFHRKGSRQDVEALAALVRQLDVTTIVVGLPLNMNGSEGPRAMSCRELGDALAQRTGVPVVYWDERLSTVAAERSLIEARVSRERRKEVIDQAAAVLILQGWLDSHAKETT